MAEVSKKQQTNPNKTLWLGDIYLIFYNVVLTVGWFLILCVTLQTAASWKSKEDALKSKNLYINVETLLLIFQSAALLEVAHAAVRLVRSNPMLTLVQVLSRLLVVWIVFFWIKAPRESVGVIMVCICWSIAEITRYAYYALNLLGMVPYFMTWIRYSFFIVLYPVGVSGELICIWNAVQFLQPLAVRTHFSYFMPNALNFSFDCRIFLILSMLSYIPVFPHLYMHMLTQRKKLLGGKKKTE